MRQIALLVEGQTEERVVAQVLAPAAWKHDIVLQPIVVCTSAGHHGGGPARGPLRIPERGSRTLG